jgi:hypothetical protein
LVGQDYKLLLPTSLLLLAVEAVVERLALAVAVEVVDLELEQHL